MMLYRNKLALILFFLIGNISCKQETKNIDCPAIECLTIPLEIKIQFIDANKQTDLFSSNSRYSIKELEIYSTRFKKNIDFDIDSLDKSKKYIVFPTLVTDEFIVKLQNLSSDTLKVETRFDTQTCCGVLELEDVSLNNQILPSTLLNPGIITISK